MKKMLSLILALICLLAIPANSLAGEANLWLYSPALDEMVYLEGEEFEEGYYELYMTGEGLILVEVLTVEAAEYGIVGEGSFEDLLEMNAAGDMRNAEEVACEGVDSYPARRIRFETGAEEDSLMVDATAIWTDSSTFVYTVTADADAWFGFTDVYAEGEVQTLVDQWISEIQIGGHDSDEDDYALPEVSLVSPALTRMTYVTGEIMEEGFYELYMSEDGLSGVTVLAVDFTEYGMVGEYSFEESLEVSMEGDFRNAEELECEAVSAYPTRRIRFETGAEEDMMVVDATAIWTDSKTFVYMVMVEADAWYGFVDGYEDGAAQAMVDQWVSELWIEDYAAETGGEADVMSPEFRAEHGIGSMDAIMETEFFYVVIPAFWRDLYECDITYSEPAGYTITFSEKESGFVFSLEARWFDDQAVELESVWQGYLGRLSVERLGALDLLVTYSQPAPDASDAWQTMYDTCRDVVDLIIMQEGVTLEEGEYAEYQP